jgi:hypothetical protein
MPSVGPPLRSRFLGDGLATRWRQLGGAGSAALESSKPSERYGRRILLRLLRLLRLGVRHDRIEDRAG